MSLNYHISFTAPEHAPPNRVPHAAPAVGNPPDISQPNENPPANPAASAATVVTPFQNFANPT